MALMIMVAVIIIASMAHVQNVVTQLKHDREEELVHRGAQYARAIKKYYKKFNQYPVSIEQLEKTNNMRFLRKRYKDPVTGGDFRLVRIADFNASQLSGGGSGGGSLNGPAAQGILNATGLGGGQQNQNTQPGASQSGSPSGFSQPLTSSGPTGPTFGGGPFLGVASTSTKLSLMEFDGKNHYKDWMFVYLPNFDRGGLIKGPYLRSQAMGGMAPATVGTPAGNLTPGTNSGPNNVPMSGSPLNAPNGITNNP